MKTVYDFAKSKMNKTVDALQRDYNAIRAGRANPQVLDKVTVEYYNTPTPIAQLATVSVPDPRSIVIAPWDKTVLREIEKAILTSDIGINPQNDGSVIRLTFPPLTEDRRKEIAKDIQKMAEQSKVALRNIRRDAVDKLKAMKKDGEITEDDIKDGEKQVQKITDGFVKEIDNLASVKEKEILTV